MDSDQFLTQFLSYQNIIIYSALVTLGMVIKQTPKIENWLIPHIILIAGVVIGYFYLGGKNGLLIGIILAGLAVFGHQLYSQLRLGFSRDDKQQTPPTDKP
jgi:branched-subunit amino acid transport protein